LPKTFVMVRPISQKTSIAKIKPTPSGGKPNIAPVANITTKLALGTPAMPLLVTKKPIALQFDCQYYRLSG
jgi:hypothetical protein